jgi:phosphoribosylglycinamide formyltransferase-1
MAIQAKNRTEPATLCIFGDVPVPSFSVACAPDNGGASLYRGKRSIDQRFPSTILEAGPREERHLMGKGFFLLAENTFESCYFVSRFSGEFRESPCFLGVILAEKKPDESCLRGRESFHSEYGGRTAWNVEMDQKWSGCYQPLSNVSRRMIQAYGVPGISVSHHTNTVFIGSDINGRIAEGLVSDICRESSPWLVSYLPKILDPWWIELFRSRVLNCHSAVLPYARGMHAIENLAALKDISSFRRAAGVTIHFIDDGIDTGPIIRAERLAEPFRFESIWELKGHLYGVGIEWYIQTVRDIIRSTGTTPAGIFPRPELQGRNYLRKHFTEETKRRAEEGYLWMKSQLPQGPSRDNRRALV